MRTETKEFFEYTKSLPFKDITHFWDIPYKEILDEIKTVDESYWRRPFDADNNQIDRMKLDDSKSVNHYPGMKGDLIEAHGWKSLCFLNETGDSKDQITRFPPVYSTAGDYKKTLKYFLNNRKWTNVSDFSPTLVKFFKEVISKYMHVGQIFVTRLESGGVITEHNDIPEDSKHLLGGEQIHVYDILNTFNLCLNHVKSCYSVFDNKVMPAYDGCLRWTNTGKQHWVVNMNKESQYQIIWQGLYKKSFRKLVKEKYKYSYGSN